MHIASVIAAAAMLAFGTPACGGVRFAGVGVNQGPFFNGFNGFGASLIQPATTFIVLPPGTVVVVLIEAVPVNGFLLTGFPFFNAFNAANPTLGSACQSVIGITNNGLVSNPFGTAPAIGLTLVPTAPGNCAFPINLGQSGVVSLSISTVATAPSIRSSR